MVCMLQHNALWFEASYFFLDVVLEENMEENEAERREMVRKKRHKRSRGLSFAEADDVISKFNQVAVNKERVSTKEQVLPLSCICADGHCLLVASLVKVLSCLLFIFCCP